MNPDGNILDVGTATNRKNWKSRDRGSRSSDKLATKPGNRNNDKAILCLYPPHREKGIRYKLKIS